MISDDPTHAPLLGRMAQEGDTALAVLAITSGPLGGVTSSGALAVSRDRLWLTQPQLLGGPSVTLLPGIIGDLFGSGIGRWPAGAAFSLILLMAGLSMAGAAFGLVYRRAGEEW